MRGIALILMLSALSALSAPQGGNAQAVGPQLQCDLQIYFYIDRSGSLKPAEQISLASSLGDVLKSEYVKDYISNERHVYLIPFAERLPDLADRIRTSPDAPADATVIQRKIMEVFTKHPDSLGVGSKNKTDMFKVVKDIDRRIGNLDEKSASNTAFIILSDFEHDLTLGDKPFDRQSDRASWERREVKDALSSLADKFQADNAPLLFLLPIRREKGVLSVAEDVLNDLEHLTRYDAQVTSADSFEHNLASVLQLLRPLEIESRVVPDGDRLVNEILVRNRSCQSLPPLVLTRVRFDAPTVMLENPLDFQLDNSSNRVRAFRLEVPSRAAPPGEPPSMPEIKVYVRLKVDAPTDSSPLAEQDVNFDSYVFLKKFVGVPTKGNQGFVDARAHLIRGYSGSKMKIRFELYRDGVRLSGESDFAEIEAQSDTAPKLIEREVTLKIGENMLPAYCCDEKWKTGRLSLKILTEPEQAKAQFHELPVSIVTNGDATRDLLENLAQQASLPALATLATLFLVALFSRSLSLGHVEELAAVAGLCFATIFLLAHHIPFLGHAMDIVLMGKPADCVGALICSFLAGVVVIFGWRGTAFPSRSESEMTLYIERDVRSARDQSWVVERNVGWRIMRYPILGTLASLIVVLGGWLLVNRPMPDCVLQVSDELSNYYGIEPSGGTLPATTPTL